MMVIRRVVKATATSRKKLPCPLVPPLLALGVVVKGAVTSLGSGSGPKGSARHTALACSRLRSHRAVVDGVGYFLLRSARKGTPMPNVPRPTLLGRGAGHDFLSVQVRVLPRASVRVAKLVEHRRRKPLSCPLVPGPLVSLLSEVAPCA